MAAIVEDQRSPVGMFALTRVGVLIQASAVEPGHRVSVFGKVSRHPVENHPDIVLVAAVNQIHQIIRAAKTGGRRVEIGNLIAPRRPVGMLGQRQKFDVGKAHFQHIGNQLIGQFAVGQKLAIGLAPPRTGMNLVNRRWLLPGIAAGASLHP